MNSEEYNKKFARRFVIVCVLICVVLLFTTLQIFLDGFLGAVILYILLRPWMRHLTLVKKKSASLSASLLMLLTFVVVLIPMYFMAMMIIPRIQLLFSSGSLTMNTIVKADEKLHSAIGVHVFTPENLMKLQASAAEYITGFVGQSLVILTDIALLYVFLYYLLVNTGKIEKYLVRVIPFSEEKMDEFATELIDQTKSNAIAIPLLAICQGLFAALGYWIFGVPEPLFWGVITGVFSLLPAIGTAFIWVPAGVYQLSEGYTWQGIAIILYGLLVIGVVDNVFRLVFQKKFADVHPLITVVGVIVGLQLFGIPGLIFGPLLISYFILLLRILKEEFL